MGSCVTRITIEHYCSGGILTAIAGAFGAFLGLYTAGFIVGLAIAILIYTLAACLILLTGTKIVLAIRNRPHYEAMNRDLLLSNIHQAIIKNSTQPLPARSKIHVTAERAKQIGTN